MRLLDEDHLVDGTTSLAAVLGWPTEAEPSVLSHSTDVVGISGFVQIRAFDLRHEVLEILPELALQIQLLRRELQVHRDLR